MQKMSISRAWDESREVLRRDGSPIAAVALALMVLPGTINDMVQPPAPAGQMPEPGWWSIVALAALLIGVVGQLAVVQIALGRRQSVGQAIAHGGRRTLPFLGATLLWVLPFVLLLAPFVRQLQANAENPPQGLVLLLFVMTIAFLFLAVRLVLTTPVASAEPIGPVAILKKSWKLSSGRWWKLFGFLVLFFIAALIAMTAVTSVVGVLVGLAEGPPEQWSIGALVLALTAQLLSAVLTVLLVCLLTRIYVQLAAEGAEPASVPHAP